MVELTARQSFKAMVLLLEDYYQRTHFDDIGIILSSAMFLPDGGTADPAYWDDWTECVMDDPMTEQQAFETTVRFLLAYQNRGPSMEVEALLKEIGWANHRLHPYPAMWEQWTECIQQVVAKEQIGDETPWLFQFVSGPILAQVQEKRPASDAHGE